MTKNQAFMLAKQVERYWRDKGYRVRVEVYLEDTSGGYEESKHFYSIRSNLINGLPRGGISQKTEEELVMEHYHQ